MKSMASLSRAYMQWRLMMAGLSRTGTKYYNTSLLVYLLTPRIAMFTSTPYLNGRGRKRDRSG